jgi:hypothetical protein
LCFTCHQWELHSTAPRCCVLFAIDKNCTWWPPSAFFSSLWNFKATSGHQVLFVFMLTKRAFHHKLPSAKFQYDCNESLYLCYLKFFSHHWCVFFTLLFYCWQIVCWKYINIMNNGFDLLIAWLWWWKE